MSSGNQLAQKSKVNYNRGARSSCNGVVNQYILDYVDVELVKNQGELSHK
jgi:hypothetical protein